MIEGFIGRPGSGKTYTLTGHVLRAANSGRRVFCNYPIAHPNVWHFQPQDFVYLPPGLIVVDEIHLWFSARMSLALPPSWWKLLSQTRKRGWDLYWSAQHESRVDRIIRDVTDYMWLCDAFLRINGHPVLFYSRSWEPEKFRSPRRRDKSVSRLSLFSSKIANSYDSLGEVQVAKHMQREDDPYAVVGDGSQR